MKFATPHSTDRAAPARLRPLALAVAAALGALALGVVLGARYAAPHDEAAHDTHDAHSAPDTGKTATAAKPDSHAESGHDDHAEEATVTFSDAQLKSQDIALAEAGPAALHSQLSLPGEIKLNQERSAQLSPPFGGQVLRVAVQAGQSVSRGQLLAVISSRAVADARAEGLAAQQRLSLAKAQLEREQQLWAAKVSPEQDLLQARQAWQEAQIQVERSRQSLQGLGVSVSEGLQGLAQYELRAPMAGVVVALQLSVGERVTEDSAVLQIADLSSLWVESSAPASALGDLRVGQRATVSASDFEAQGPATLSLIAPVVADTHRRAPLRLTLPNPRGLWRPGLPVTVALNQGQASTPAEVTVPLTAVHSMAEQESVVFVREGERFEARPVRLGARDGERVAVLSGLKAGERVATRNSFIIKAEFGKEGAGHEH